MITSITNTQNRVCLYEDMERKTETPIIMAVEGTKIAQPLCLNREK